MASTNYSIPINGTKVAIGPFPFPIRSITLINKCDAGDLFVLDDQGTQYEATALTADTWKADDSVYLTAYIDTPQTSGALQVIVSSEEPTSPVNTAQLSTLTPLSKMQIAHNGVIVGSEVTVDFEDLPLPWAIADSIATQKITVAALIDADGSIPITRPLKVTNKDSGGGGQNCILYLLNTVSARKAYVYQDDAGELLLGEFGGKNTIVVALGTGRVTVPYALLSGGLESGSQSVANLMFVQRTVQPNDARTHTESGQLLTDASGNVSYTFVAPYIAGATVVSDVLGADARSNAHLTNLALTTFSAHAEVIGAGAFGANALVCFVSGGL